MLSAWNAFPTSCWQLTPSKNSPKFRKPLQMKLTPLWFFSALPLQLIVLVLYILYKFFEYGDHNLFIFASQLPKESIKKVYKNDSYIPLFIFGKRLDLKI